MSQPFDDHLWLRMQEEHAGFADQFPTVINSRVENLVTNTTDAITDTRVTMMVTVPIVARLVVVLYQSTFGIRVA